MAKAPAREYVFLQCEECGDLNYRTMIRTAGGGQKLTLKKFCARERKHTEHKTKKK
jgi:large subunit ribosomal protein L33